MNCIPSPGIQMNSTPAESWRKSSRSANAGGQCVEACTAESVVAVRDSKSPASGLLRLESTQWTSLLVEVKVGRLDRSIDIEDVE